MKEELSRKIRNNRISAFVCLIVGLIYFTLIYFQASPREVPGARGFGKLTGRFFPELGGGTFILCSVFMLVKSFFNEKLIMKTDDADMIKSMMERNESVVGVTKFEFVVSFSIMALGLIYVSLIPYSGYLVGTAIAVFALSWAMGNKNWFYLFILSIIVPSIIYYIFISLLYVPLPRGILDF